MSEERVRCAHRDCDELIPATVGSGPPRRYCCRQHRTDARRRRVRTRIAEGDVVVLVRRTGPSRPPSAPGGAARTEQRTTGPTAPPPRPARPARPRHGGRTLTAAVLLSLVGTSGGLLITQHDTDGPVPPRSTSVALTAQAHVWAGHAQVVLSSLQTDRGALTDAEQRWQQLPPQSRAGDPPGPIRDLLDRIVLRNQQIDHLQAGLASVAQLDRLTASNPSHPHPVEAAVRGVIAQPLPELATSGDIAASVTRLVEAATAPPPAPAPAPVRPKPNSAVLVSDPGPQHLRPAPVPPPAPPPPAPPEPAPPPPPPSLGGCELPCHIPGVTVSHSIQFNGNDIGSND